VDERVLIPRNETELLVEKSVIEINKNKYKNILEVGTGSGCIGLSILNDVDHPISLVMTDISTDALAVAKINRNKLQYRSFASNQVSFMNTDRLNGIDGQFDCIVTNPPYIKRSAAKLVHSQVDQYEPHIALYLEDEEYEMWFEELFRQVSGRLEPGGFFMMEGHEDELQNLKKLAAPFFSSTMVEKDYTRVDRFLSARR
jgi:release factor glutamine methyltransferase